MLVVEEQESAAVRKWLNNIKMGVRVCRYTFNRFLRWFREYGGSFKDYSPDELVEYQKMVVGDHRYDLLDVVEEYIRSKKGCKGYKNHEYAIARSFFLHNLAELPLNILCKSC
ncbi:MAG: hypothetical protein V1850_06625 [Candidatus Bathyarchaeota archaeon]